MIKVSAASYKVVYRQWHYISFHLLPSEYMTHIVERDALHRFVLFDWVHLVQVSVSNEHSPVLRLVEVVDLRNTFVINGSVTHHTLYRCY